MEADSYNASVYDTCRFSANLSSEDTTATFRVPVKDSGQGYIYVDCGAANDISVAVYEDGVSTSSWSVSHSEPFIIDGGRFDGTQEVQVTIGAESSVSGNIYVVTLDDAVYQEHMAALSAGGMQVTSFTDSSVKGTISAREDGAVFTSIPYDAGWTVKVDGKKVETYGVGERDFQGNNGAMLAFDIGQGEHTVELSFLPRGLLAGILISVLCLGLLILLLVLTRKPRPDTGAGDAAAGCGGVAHGERGGSWRSGRRGFRKSGSGDRGGGSAATGWGGEAGFPKPGKLEKTAPVGLARSRGGFYAD